MYRALNEERPLRERGEEGVKARGFESNSVVAEQEPSDAQGPRGILPLLQDWVSLARVLQSGIEQRQMLYVSFFSAHASPFLDDSLLN